jgi:hypothetical protein
MRVICLVPSWTETLLDAGVNVVGRTRFCIYPADKAASIPVVAGTKQVDWPKILELKPDLLVLDKEENPISFADQSHVPWVATHVTSVWDVGKELQCLYARLGQTEVLAIAERWLRTCERLSGKSGNRDWLQMPGVMEWLRRPGPEVEQFLYIIWKDPWMAVGPGTFIASVFTLLGYGSRLAPLSDKYPAIRLEDYDPTRTLLLFSSEPYPFARHANFLADLPFPSAIVDGERFAWFGVRALRFLESCEQPPVH